MCTVSSVTVLQGGKRTGCAWPSVHARQMHCLVPASFMCRPALCTILHKRMRRFGDRISSLIDLGFMLDYTHDCAYAAKARCALPAGFRDCCVRGTYHKAQLLTRKWGSLVMQGTRYRLRQYQLPASGLLGHKTQICRYAYTTAALSVQAHSMGQHLHTYKQMNIDTRQCDAFSVVAPRSHVQPAQCRPAYNSHANANCHRNVKRTAVRPHCSNTI